MRRPGRQGPDHRPLPQAARRRRAIQFLGADETGDPTGRAWTEFGNLDKTGHDEGIGLARRIPELLASLVLRIESLLAAGWQEVRVVTDHGWLLLPGGLPKSDLPKYLTATRWRRCAVVKPTATVELPCFSWFWADDVRIACPPGIDCFMAGEEYNHGGLSLQECVVPQLRHPGWHGAGRLGEDRVVKWAGLRCRVKLAGSFDGLQGGPPRQGRRPDDLAGRRRRPSGQDGTVVPGGGGRHAARGRATTLVLLDPAGNVVDEDAGDGGRVNGRDGTRPPGPARRRGVRRVHRPQGPGAAVRPPVPGADLRLRVPARPLLRQHRRGGDPGRAADRRAATPRPDRPQRRGGAVQGPRQGDRLGQAHRHHLGPPGRQDRLVPGHPAEPATEGREHRRTSWSATTSGC